MDNKKRPIGLWFISAAVLLLIAYYYHPLYLGTYKDMDLLFKLSAFSFIAWLDIAFSIILIFAVTYGFYYARPWARYFTIFVSCYSGFWAIVSIFIWNSQVIEHFVYFIIYVLTVIYLLMSWVTDYFYLSDSYKILSGKTEIWEEGGKECYKHLDYVLYKRNIKKRGGGTRVFYFFSKDENADGQTCTLPDDYKVCINKKTGIPYLKKKK